MKIVISTGGTGGHIYPALALARYMRESQEDIEILFTGSSKHMEKDIVSKAGFNFFGYSISSGSKSIFHKIFQMFQLFFSLIKVYFKFVFNRPDVVMGFGAYITAPTLMAAKFLNIPIILHEQNSSMGKTNDMFFKTAKAVIVCYESVQEEYQDDKVFLLGNPRASEVYKIHSNRHVITEFGLNPEKKTILIVMGSLGSASVNDAMFELMPQLASKDYQVIYVTGNKHFELLRDEDYKNIKIVPYIDQAHVLKNVDLVIARGGATTAAEICALKVPSIIIPSPYVSNNHQFINALELEKVHASKIIKEDELTAARLIEQIDDLIYDDKLLNEMSENAFKLAKVNASRDIVTLIRKTVDHD